MFLTNQLTIGRPLGHSVRNKGQGHIFSALPSPTGTALFLSVCQSRHQEFSRRPWGSSVRRKAPPPAPVTPLPVEMLRGSERLASSLPSDCLICSDASSLSVGSILCLIASESTQGNSPQPIHQHAMHVHLLRQRKYPEGCRGSRYPRFKR